MEKTRWKKLEKYTVVISYGDHLGNKMAAMRLVSLLSPVCFLRLFSNVTQPLGSLMRGNLLILGKIKNITFLMLGNLQKGLLILSQIGFYCFHLMDFTPYKVLHAIFRNKHCRSGANFIYYNFVFGKASAIYPFAICSKVIKDFFGHLPKFFALI